MKSIFTHMLAMGGFTFLTVPYSITNLSDLMKYSSLKMTSRAFFLQVLFMLLGSLPKAYAQPVTNDDCANAIFLNSVPSCSAVTGTTLDATQSLPAITCESKGTADDDVWYKFTAVSTTHTVTVVGMGSFDAVLDVRSGSCNGNTIACADATRSGEAETTTISGLTVDNIYYVRVYSYGSNFTHRGTFTICVTAVNVPANDECVNAITLTPGNSCFSTTGTTLGATQSLPAISCDGFTASTADDDVWYKFIATDVTHAVMVVGMGGFDAVLDVRSGSCNGNTIACSDATFNGETETAVVSNLTVGNTYYVRVYSWGNLSSDRGTFTICVTAVNVPANDECVNAITLTPGNSCFSTTGTTLGATQSLPAISCGGFTTSTADDDVWYKFIATDVTHAVMVVGMGGFDAVLDVRPGSCNGNTIACSDATLGSGTETAVVSNLTVGNIYYIRVYSYGGTPSHRGTFTICVTTVNVPANECPNAIVLTSTTSCAPTVGTTVNATQSLPAITCGSFTPGMADDDVWYKFIAASTSQIVTVVGVDDFDPIIDVRTGSCNGTTIVCADATGNGGTETAAASGLTIGNTYYVRVYSWGNSLPDRGNFTICITHVRCPDLLTVSEPITSVTVLKQALQITATNQISGAMATYRATQSVTLQPGFSATTGTGNLFQAIIGGCDTP